MPVPYAKDLHLLDLAYKLERGPLSKRSLEWRSGERPFRSLNGNGCERRSWTCNYHIPHRFMIALLHMFYTGGKLGAKYLAYLNGLTY